VRAVLERGVELTLAAEGRRLAVHDVIRASMLGQPATRSFAVGAAASERREFAVFRTNLRFFGYEFFLLQRA
jgi:hypothetical protein